MFGSSAAPSIDNGAYDTEMLLLKFLESEDLYSEDGFLMFYVILS